MLGIHCSKRLLLARPSAARITQNACPRSQSSSANHAVLYDWSILKRNTGKKQEIDPLKAVRPTKVLP